MSKSTKSRNDFLKMTALNSAAVTLPSFHITSRLLPGDEVIGHGDFRYRVHTNWGSINPATTPVNNCHEMVMDKKGRLIMIIDETKNNIIIKRLRCLSIVVMFISIAIRIFTCASGMQTKHIRSSWSVYNLV